jgi:hypothetical protein
LSGSFTNDSVVAKWFPGGGADANGLPDALVDEPAVAAVVGAIEDGDFDDFPDELDPHAASTSARMAVATAMRDVVFMWTLLRRPGAIRTRRRRGLRRGGLAGPASAIQMTSNVAHGH